MIGAVRLVACIFAFGFVILSVSPVYLFFRIMGLLIQRFSDIV